MKLVHKVLKLRMLQLILNMSEEQFLVCHGFLATESRL